VNMQTQAGGRHACWEMSECPGVWDRGSRQECCCFSCCWKQHVACMAPTVLPPVCWVHVQQRCRKTSPVTCNIINNVDQGCGSVR
jgi:hypothetical protein